MANNIERLNYYEREYLRSFDFIAEQNYHIEMRRRLNLALHLWGIVEGLNVELSEVVQGAPPQYHITPGMAIDAFGREIFLFAPYILSEDDVTRNRITLPGRYSLFIAYATDLATPPSAGFAVCDLADQYTRRHESYQIVISNQLDDSVDPKKVKVPTATDELSDDPAKKPWPVRLGSVDIDANLMITNAWPKNRTYIGIRAQRIVAPVASLGDSAPDANRPITVEADLRTRKNTIIGKDFEVLKADTTPTPTIDPFPSQKGNLKVRHDLFMRGEFYKLVDTKWLSISEYVKSLMPDVLTGFQDITFPGNSLALETTGKETFTVTSNRLKKIGDAHATVAISSFRFNNRQDVAAIVGNLEQISLRILDVSTSPIVGQDNGRKIDVRWAVTPTDLNNAQFRSPIIAATISYVVVCYP